MGFYSKSPEVYKYSEYVHGLKFKTKGTFVRFIAFVNVSLLAGLRNMKGTRKVICGRDVNVLKMADSFEVFDWNTILTIK